MSRAAVVSIVVAALAGGAGYALARRSVDPGPLAAGRPSGPAVATLDGGAIGRTELEAASFLGRKVYLGAVVVLVSAMRYGATPARMRELRDLVGVSRRTVERWRAWWREAFAEGAFWRIASTAFMPPVEAGILPVSLLERFSGADEARLVGLLRFLGPLTGGTGTMQAR